MNEKMRRYLSDDWDGEYEEPSSDRKRDASTIPPAVKDRRQQDKQRGRAMAKYHRDMTKLRGKSGKL